ncbi:MAG: polysaccharide deacetylase family protein [Candidatus Cloacimonetes bacterium]|nr:polysaccharide deacetylase family protein [Candidatus Cloacimonadota bacterium]
MLLFPKFVFKVKTEKKIIALTFDDGPHPEFTEELLDIFKEKNVKATFFVTGTNIESQKHLILRMINEGHELGNHSYSHKNLIFRSPGKIRDEILKTDKLLRELGVKGAIHFRPPFGRILLSACFVMQSLKKKVIMWNIPTKDFKEPYPEVIISRIYNRLKPGSIIVLHDSGLSRNGKNIDRKATIAAVKEIVQELPKRGYQFKTISELINN